MSAEHEEMENDVAAFVLGSLDGDAEDRVRAHLETCARCRELAARLAPTVSALALEPEAVDPPSGLEERLIAAAQAGQSRPSAAAQPPPRIVPLRPPRAPQRSLGLRGGLAAAAALLLAVGVGAGIGLDRLGLSRLGGSQPSTAQVQRYRLTGTGSLAGADARAVYLEREDLALVDFRRLPATDPTHVYQLWLIDDQGRPVSAGVFVPDPDGSKVVLVDRSLSGVKMLAVTVEPGPDGSPAPSQPPQLEGSVA
jgi:anti-sigma-K factor RskA